MNSKVKTLFSVAFMDYLKLKIKSNTRSVVIRGGLIGKKEENKFQKKPREVFCKESCS